MALCYFYATREDLLAVTEEVESVMPIKYVRFGQTTKLPPKSFKSASEIPNLGIATNPSAVGCEKFLVCDSQVVIKARALKVLAEEDVNRSMIENKSSLTRLIGQERFAIDQLVNPETICFRSGGLWNSEILLHGGIDTASQSKPSMALMKEFKKAIQRNFTKIKAFYVGLQALGLLKSGYRLTISAQSPKEFDLAMESTI
jgi:hypothetical protein